MGIVRHKTQRVVFFFFLLLLFCHLFNGIEYSWTHLSFCSLSSMTCLVNRKRKTQTECKEKQSAAIEEAENEKEEQRLALARQKADMFKWAKWFCFLHLFFLLCCCLLHAFTLWLLLFSEITLHPCCPRSASSPMAIDLPVCVCLCVWMHMHLVGGESGCIGDCRRRPTILFFASIFAEAQ